MATNQLYKITRGWHRLFVGGNRHVTYGIQVTCLCDKKESDSQGKKHVFEINDATFKSSDPEHICEILAITNDERLAMIAEVEKLPTTDLNYFATDKK